jgi:hypothetical protein
MKKLLLTAAALVALTTPVMAERTDFTFEQTAVQSSALPSPQYPNAKIVLVSYILKNNLDREYKNAKIVCSLFVNGKLVGTALNCSSTSTRWPEYTATLGQRSTSGLTLRMQRLDEKNKRKRRIK